jgi:hypothetical protein
MTQIDLTPAENDISRFIARPEDVHVFREADMECASCRHSIGKASECDIYELKSAGVMRGERICPDYSE